MKKISTEVVSRSLGSRLVRPMLAASMLAAMSLPFSSAYAGGALSTVISTGAFEPDGLAVSPDGESLFCVATTAGPAFHSELIVINTQFNTITAEHPLFVFGTGTHSAGGIQIVENPAEQLIFVLNYLTDTIDVVSEATNTQIATFTPANIGPNPTSFAVTPNGKELWVANSGPGNNNGTVQVIDSDPTSANFGKAINLVNLGGSPNTIAFNTPGSLAYVLNGGAAGFVDEIKVSTGDIIRDDIGLSPAVLNFPNPLAMAINKKATQLYIANGFTILNVLDVPSGKVPSRIFMFAFDTPPGFDQQLGQVLLSPSGKTAYTANIGDGSVGLATVATGLAKPPIFLPLGAVPYFMALSPSGTTLYVSNFNNAVAGPFGGLTSISVITGLSK
jgi:DNA-binding beta-propeller fold protein YncE